MTDCARFRTIFVHFVDIPCRPCYSKLQVTSIFKNERQNLILQYLTANGSVRVTELARTLNVDPVTIRRDLAHLEDAGYLHRVHGGAIPSSGQVIERQPIDPDLALKRRIAQHDRFGCHVSAHLQKSQLKFDLSCSVSGRALSLRFVDGHSN